MDKISVLPNGNVKITIDYIFIKRSGRKKLIIDENKADQENLDMCVIRALARARYWNTQLASGKYSTIKEIAKHVGTDKSYIGRTIRLSALSPFICRMFLNGTSPSGLTLSKLLSTHLPASWEEQHKLFGINL